MAFIAAVAALAVFNVAAAFPHGYPHGHGVHSPCPAPLPEIVPVVVQSILPSPVNIGPAAPGVIEHASAPYELNYFEKPWIVKHQKGAALNVYTQTPVVVDEYSAPAYAEAAAPPAIIVEEVCAAPAAPIYAPAAVYASPARYAAPAPCY